MLENQDAKIAVKTADKAIENEMATLAKESNIPEIVTTLKDKSGKWASAQFTDLDKQGNPTSVSMLDWTRQTELTEPQMSAIIELATRIRSEVVEGETADLIIVGLGGSIECIKMLLGIFGTDKKSPNIHYFDTVDPLTVKDTLLKVNLSKTRLIAITKSFTTLEVVSLYKIFFNKMVEAASKISITKEEMAERITVITDETTDVTDKAKYEIAATGMGKEVFRIPRGTGGRFSWDTPISIVTSMIMGHPVEQLRIDAKFIENLSVTETNFNKNPATHYALFKAVMHKKGRFVSTLLIPPILKRSGTWAGQLNDESLGKEAIDSVLGEGVRALTLDHEPLARDISEYGDDRYFVVLKLGENDSTFNKKVAELKAAGFPVYEIVVPSKEHIAQYMKMAEFATIFAGNLLGINPVTQRNVVLYKTNQAKYVSKEEPVDTEHVIEAKGIKVDYSPSIADTKAVPSEINSLVKLIGERTPASVTAALMHLAAKEKGRDYIVQMIYRRLNPEIQKMQDNWRVGVRGVLKGVSVLGEEAPCILHAKQQGFQAWADKGFFMFVRYMDCGKNDIEIPDLGYTLGKLVRAQARGSLDALTSAEKPGQKGEFYNGMGVRVDLKDTSSKTQTAFDEYLKDIVQNLNKLANY